MNILINKDKLELTFITGIQNISTTNKKLKSSLIDNSFNKVPKAKQD